MELKFLNTPHLRGSRKKNAIKYIQKCQIIPWYRNKKLNNFQKCLRYPQNIQMLQIRKIFSCLKEVFFRFLYLYIFIYHYFFF